MYHDHFNTQQEMGLAPKAATKVDVTQRRSGSYHDVFTFLMRDQALELKRLEAAVDAGTVDLLQSMRR